MTKRKQWIAAGGLLLILSAALSAAVVLTDDPGAVGPGTEAPAFEATDINSGAPVSLNDYRGRVVLLNIWATSCLSCEEEMPSMQRLYEQLRDRPFSVVAVSTDVSSREHVKDWIDERGLTFDVLHDRERRIERTYQTTGVPESFLIDPTGMIMKREIGAREWDNPSAKALIERLLDAFEPQPSSETK